MWNAPELNVPMNNPVRQAALYPTLTSHFGDGAMRKTTISLFLFSLGLLGCGRQDVPLSILLRNNDDTQFIHVYSPNTSQGSENRVEANTSQYSNFFIIGTNGQGGTTVDFVAGRDDAVLAELTCEIGLDEDGYLKTIAIVWDGRDLACGE
jgi:hypothetical protein